MTSATGERATILHPTDFAGGGELAFVHALRIALRTKYALSLLRVRREDDATPTLSGLRHVIEVLARWKMLNANAPISALASELDLQASSVGVPAVNVRTGILDYLDHHPCELTVIATHERKGLAHWLDVSVEQTALRSPSGMILFLRDGEHGFVDPKTGEIHLRKILVPIDGGVELFPSIYRLEALTRRISMDAEIHFFHVGVRAPAIRDSKGDFLNAPVQVRQGPLVETILEAARRMGVDVIAMPTAGRHGLIGALRSGVTARILDDARWPLLAIPAH
jgi:nucleotide-binding universal stress UspA family protein